MVFLWMYGVVSWGINLRNRVVSTMGLSVDLYFLSYSYILAIDTNHYVFLETVYYHYSSPGRQIVVFFEKMKFSGSFSTVMSN